MVAQRRYSVTGQTPPDDAEAMKARSPKLQALDTSAHTTTCGLCDGAAETCKLSTAGEDSSSEQLRGRKTGVATQFSSKRSATQLPSPSSPSHDLPAKVARYRLSPGEHGDLDAEDMDVDTDAGSSSDLEPSDVFRDDIDYQDGHVAGVETQDTSFSSTPDYLLSSSECSLPDAASLEQLQLCAEDDLDDDCMEDLALSPPHSRNHSLDRTCLSERQQVSQNWSSFHKIPPVPPKVEEEQSPASLPADNAQTPLTFLTLPPEIRHHIYRHCRNIIIDKPLVYCISTFDGEMQHPLASVSRQVRSESLSIFYSYNIWVIKVEFRMMYEAFQDWIIRLGPGAGLLRLVSFSVRGSLFRPKRSHTPSVAIPAQLLPAPTTGATGPGPGEDLYCPPDGDASFHIDLSEKFVGGRVILIRNDGSQEAGEKAVVSLGEMVERLWEKRRAGTLNGQDWVTMVDSFITFIGGW